MPIQRALISVSDKSGIVEFVQSLRRLPACSSLEILSTGGTARLLAEHGIPVTEVSDYTGFPEIMGGRVKTLHPKVHGGLLGRRGVDEDVMSEQGIRPIDLLVVNLYPFSRTIAAPACQFHDAVENIDIGGPALLRAAAKNHAAVAVVCDADDYAGLLEELAANEGSVTEPTRRYLAAKVFSHTAVYDAAIAGYLTDYFAELYLPEEETGGGEEEESPLPARLNLGFEKVQDMRYGENPHQRAGFYRETGFTGVSVANARQLQGKELSYNNVADSDAALACAGTFEEAACVIVKHANPCGVAVAPNILAAYEAAFATDPTSAFGGIIAFNRPLDRRTAETIVERQFLEVLLAPAIEEDALPILATKKNIRVLTQGGADAPNNRSPDSPFEYKGIMGALLVQERDSGTVKKGELRIVTRRAPTDEEMADLKFAWKVVKFVKSNAIVYCRDARTLGIGAGQMSRVYSARIAAIKAADEGLSLKGAVMASDAFFPFRDGIDAAAEHGITAVVQPGGSVRDEEVIEGANEHGMAMVFTGMRHFRH